jgi:uncharacterized Ntn-hydrolase superfamily protein
MQPAGTFSIVAMDPDTNEWGIAVASRVVDVGYAVAWLRAEIGGVASQALSNPYLGLWALDELAKGRAAGEALEAALARDEAPEVRQVGLVDRFGNAAAHTGASTIEWSGHRTAQFVSVQGNILTGPQVVDSMLGAFQGTAGPLGARLLTALEAGEASGGDKRGKQSAALFVVKKRGGYQGVDDRLIDLKVTDNSQPVKELRRVFERWQYAYLAPAYVRLADEEKDRSEGLMQHVRALVQKALGSHLDDPGIYNNLAWELALRKKYPQEALAAARRGLSLAPEDSGVMDTLAEALYAAGEHEEAIRWEREALKRAPDNAFFRRQLEKFTRSAER